MSKIREVYVEFENYPAADYPAHLYPDADVPNATQEGPIKFLDPCINRHESFALTWENQAEGPQVKYTNVEVSLTEAVITPASCQPSVEYTCDSVTRPADSDPVTLDCSDVTIGPDPDADSPSAPPKVTVTLTPEDYKTDSGKKPGRYCVALKATNSVDTTNVPAESVDSELCFEVVDPCNPPDSVTAPTFTAQSYTISDSNATPYTHEAFTISPDYCEIKFDYGETKFTDDQGQK